jgi:ketosteroid isomerase-like protein
MDELIELERNGWRALSEGGQAAVAFYDGVLAEDAVMIFPGGMLIKGKARILETMAGPPWQWFEILDPQVLALSDDTYAVAYEVSAQREGDEVYRALISSIYTRAGDGWQLVLHQQSPA